MDGSILSLGTKSCKLAEPMIMEKQKWSLVVYQGYGEESQSESTSWPLDTENPS